MVYQNLNNGQAQTNILNWYSAGIRPSCPDPAGVQGARRVGDGVGGAGLGGAVDRHLADRRGCGDAAQHAVRRDRRGAHGEPTCVGGRDRGERDGGRG